MDNAVRPEAGTYLAKLLEEAPIGVVRLDAAGLVAAANPRAASLLGVGQRDLEGRGLGRLFRDESVVDGALKEVIATGEEATLRLERGPSEAPSFIEVKAYRFDDESGAPAAVAMLEDVTDGVVVARQREEIRQQVEFLAETSARLGSSVDLDEVFAQIVEIFVPMLADWCVLDVLDRDGAVQRIGVGHRDPALAETAEALRVIRPNPDQRQHPVVRALVKEKPVIINDIGPETYAELAYDPDHAAVIRELGARSCLVVPLHARGRLLGSLTLVSATNPRRFGAEQLALAQDVATRAALAIDNARLMGEHVYLARKLQESLLPPALPNIPGLEVAAHYRPASVGIEVGGDFYDFFRTGAKSWNVVIGDVSGKGPDAAVVTTLMRYTIRAAAMQARAPRRILSTLSEAVYRQTGPERFATCAFVRIRTDGAPGARKIVVACGGHPLPLVLRANGTVEEVGVPGTVIGLMERSEIKDQTATLQPGDAMVLYTDGVTEARNAGHMLGIHGLRTALAGLKGATAQEIAEGIAAMALEFQKEQRDDIALVVLRVPPTE